MQNEIVIAPAAGHAIKSPFDRVSFSRQFLLASAFFLIGSMAVMGIWLSRQIEHSSVNRAAAMAGAYVESILVAQLNGGPADTLADPAIHTVLDQIFIHGPLTRKIARFKLWSNDGMIIYSSDHSQIGRRFPINASLQAAIDGNVRASVSDLTGGDNSPERETWPELLEVYVPIRLGSNDRGAAVAEFYYSMENLGREVHEAQHKTWMLISMTTLAIYLALFGLVRRASTTITDQQQALNERLRQLSASLGENERIREQIRDAGEKTTALNEQLLHRVVADLHDGPAQEISFALMRFDDLVQTCGQPGDIEITRNALRRALDELRGIATGLGIPGIADLSLGETLRRAISDFERKTSTVVTAAFDDGPGYASIATKITAYRVLQESLNNAWLHARHDAPSVKVIHGSDALEIEVLNRGAGFDPAAAAAKGRLGIAFMRERVRLLGGVFEISSAPDQGTRIQVRLPLESNEARH